MGMEIQVSFLYCLFRVSHIMVPTLESEIDVGQGINVGTGKSGKKNKYRALNKHRASEF